ncbi:choice-of-anchor D domain-containing protein [Candidatus Halobeggiatoa sp. HSG11]|nr:choice-of-anchor D domain-containing protein [Candidatus Halobeggiatoa sp. HSG11]
MNQILSSPQLAVLFIILLNSMAAWADGIIRVSTNSGSLSNGITLVGLNSTTVGTAGSSKTFTITNTATDGSTLNITDIIVPDNIIISTTAFSLTDDSTGKVKKTFNLHIADTATTDVGGTVTIVNDAFSDYPVSGNNPNNFIFRVNGYVKGTGIVKLVAPITTDINSVTFTAAIISPTTSTSTVNCNVIGTGIMTSFSPTSIASRTSDNVPIKVNLAGAVNGDVVKCTLTNDIDTVSGSPASLTLNSNSPPIANINLAAPTVANINKAVFNLTPSVATTALTTVNCSAIGSGAVTSFNPQTVPINTIASTAITVNLAGIVNNDTVQCKLTNPVDYIAGSPANYTFNLSPNLLMPELDIWEGGIEIKHGDSIDFGTTKIGSPIEKQILLKNTSNTTLNIYDINPPEGFRIISTDLDFTILSGQELAVNVLFEAIEVGNFNGSLTIASNDADNNDGDGVENPYTFLIQGIVESPITVSPNIQILEGTTVVGDMVDFGVTSVGIPLVKTFTIKNSGDANLVVDISSIGKGFIVGKPYVNVIAPNTSTIFNVSLNAAKIGDYTSVISVTNNSTNSPVNIIINGEVKFNTAIGAEIQLFHGITEITDGSLIPIDIGTTRVGQPITKRFTMKNIGDETIDLYGYRAPNGFNITSIYPKFLAANEEFTFDLQLSTLAIGNFTGPIELYNTDANENPFDFTITGKVIGTDVVGVVNPEIQVIHEDLDVISDTNISVDFGTTALGINMTKTFTIKNVGSSILTLISSPAVSGSGFRVTSFPIATQLVPGAATNFNVTLDASTAGSFVDILSFSNNDADESTFNFPISGTVSATLREEINCFRIGLVSGGVCSPAQPFNVISANGGTTDAQMKGGLSLYSNGKFSDFNQMATINQFNSVLTAGVIKTDSKHIGKKADIMVIGYHVDSNYPMGYQWYQLASCTTCPLGWKVSKVKSDETTAIPLLTKANLSPLKTINKMPEYLTVDMYSGAFRIVGPLDMYLAYRVEEGDEKGKIIVTSPGINIMLLDK